MILVVDNLLGIVKTFDAMMRAGVAHESKFKAFWFTNAIRIRYKIA